MQLSRVPIFTIPELLQRIETQAPEIRTFFYKELIKVMAKRKKVVLEFLTNISFKLNREVRQILLRKSG